MSIQHIFVISRAGSLVFDWQHRAAVNTISARWEWPLGLVLERIDQRATVVLGEREGVKTRWFVSSVDGASVSDGRVTLEDGQTHDVIEYLSCESNYPVHIQCSPPCVTTNQKIILSSMFHGLYEIAAQVSPALRSSGIQTLDTSSFRLNSLQTRTGVKFVVITSPNSSVNVDELLRRLYELYADFALKNPFYAIDMPVRCQKFDDGVKQLLERFDRGIQIA